MPARGKRRERQNTQARLWSSPVARSGIQHDRPAEVAVKALEPDSELVIPTVAAPCSPPGSRPAPGIAATRSSPVTAFGPFQLSSSS